MKVLVQLKLEKIQNEIKVSKLLLKRNPDSEKLKQRLENANKQYAVIIEKFPHFLI